MRKKERRGSPFYCLWEQSPPATAIWGDKGRREESVTFLPPSFSLSLVKVNYSKPKLWAPLAALAPCFYPPETQMPNDKWNSKWDWNEMQTQISRGPQPLDSPFHYPKLLTGGSFSHVRSSSVNLSLSVLGTRKCPVSTSLVFCFLVLVEVDISNFPQIACKRKLLHMLWPNLNIQNSFNNLACQFSPVMLS